MTAQNSRNVNKQCKDCLILHSPQNCPNKPLSEKRKELFKIYKGRVPTSFIKLLEEQDKEAVEKLMDGGKSTDCPCCKNWRKEIEEILGSLK